MILDYLRHFDQASFLVVYNFFDSQPFLEALAFYVARYAILVYFLVVIGLFVWPGKDKERVRRKKVVVYVLICLALAFLADEVINLLKVRHRPFVTFSGQVVKLDVIQDLTSFPSTHTIFVFAIAVSLWLSDLKKFAGPLIVLAIVLGLSRIAVGVHYPFDILGGAILGIVIPVIVHHQGSWFKQKLLNHRELL